MNATHCCADRVWLQSCAGLCIPSSTRITPYVPVRSPMNSVPSHWTLRVPAVLRDILLSDAQVYHTLRFDVCTTRFSAVASESACGCRLAANIAFAAWRVRSEDRGAIHSGSSVRLQPICEIEPPRVATETLDVRKRRHFSTLLPPTSSYDMGGRVEMRGTHFGVSA